VKGYFVVFGEDEEEEGIGGVNGLLDVLFV
jgi:hypothetical protein